MTNKAQAVLQRMKRRRLFGDPEARDRVLGEFNQSTLDDIGPVGGEQGMKVLSEMNSLVDYHDAFVQSLAPTTKLL